MYFFNKPLFHFTINRCKLTNYWQCIYDSVFANLFLKKNKNDNGRTNNTNNGNNFYLNKKASVCL